MPTRSAQEVPGLKGRWEFGVEAVRQFLWQRYDQITVSEIIIVDDKGGPLKEVCFDNLGVHSGKVKYMEVPAGTSTGEKFNIGARVAQGEYLLLWSDDDWRGTRYVQQLASFAHSTVCITGIAQPLYYDTLRKVGWLTSGDLNKRLHVGEVHGATLFFPKDIFSIAGVKFRDTCLGEDSQFIRDCAEKKIFAFPVQDIGEFIYIRHSANTWKFPVGRFKGSGWVQVDECELQRRLKFPRFNHDFYNPLHNPELADKIDGKFYSRYLNPMYYFKKVRAACKKTVW